MGRFPARFTSSFIVGRGEPRLCYSSLVIAPITRMMVGGGALQGGGAVDGGAQQGGEIKIPYYENLID